MFGKFNINIYKSKKSLSLISTVTHFWSPKTYDFSPTKKQTISTLTVTFYTIGSGLCDQHAASYGHSFSQWYVVHVNIVFLSKEIEKLS